MQQSPVCVDSRCYDVVINVDAIFLAVCHDLYCSPVTNIFNTCLLAFSADRINVKRGKCATCWRTRKKNGKAEFTQNRMREH